MIVAQGVTKYYNLKPAAQNVSFQIGKRDIVGLLGPKEAVVFVPLIVLLAGILVWYKRRPL
jgi:ABC-type lipopolysaccharide export system ATPase subunit